LNDERGYRDQGKPHERRFLACPHCGRSVEDADANPIGTCDACDRDFTKSTALTVEADNARRALVKHLEPLPPSPGLTTTQRFAISGAVVGGIIVSTLVFGAMGAGIALATVGIIWVVAMNSFSRYS
jgi:hypothetical protein